MVKNCDSKMIDIFKALANPVRFDIVRVLSEGEKCVCEIQRLLNDYEQPHISKGLAKLKAAGLIKDRREGANVYYSLAICCVGEFFACLSKLVAEE